jgi:hypothetical protein
LFKTTIYTVFVFSLLSNAALCIGDTLSPTQEAVQYTSIEAITVVTEGSRDLIIQADKLSYSEDGRTIDAYGSVDAVSPDLNIKAKHIIYDIKNKDIAADDGFEMKFMNGLDISGEALQYNSLTKNGSAENINILYKRSTFSGERAIMDDEKIQLSGASFNTCGLNPPHYKITSNTTTLYTEDGWVIGYFGFLWINEVPLVPVPVYLYDLSVQGTGSGRNSIKDVMPIPEFGSNDEDGSFVSYNIPWIANKKLNGKLNLLYSQKGQMSEGIDGNYEINDYNDLNFRAFYDGRYNTFGGITQTHYFGPRIGKVEQSIYNFFKIKEKVQFELSTDISKYERINYERVSKLPNLTIRSNDVPAIYDNFSVGGEASYGYITEETTGRGDTRGNISGHGYFNFPTLLGNARVGGGTNQTWYGITSNWTKVYDNLRFSQDYDNGLDTYISNTHYLYYEGDSIFNYEMYHTAPSDEIGVGLGYNFGVHRISVNYSYFVPDWEPIELDYGLTIGFHCYNVDIHYRATRGELVFGISLIAQ